MASVRALLPGYWPDLAALQKSSIRTAPAASALIRLGQTPKPAVVPSALALTTDSQPSLWGNPHHLKTLIPSTTTRVSLQKALKQAPAFTPPYLTTEPRNALNAQLYPREFGVSVYGSARIQPGTDLYHQIQALGAAIASHTIHADNREQPLFVMTGGGLGAMQAAAEGAQSIHGHSVAASMSFESPELDARHYNEYRLMDSFAGRLSAPGGFIDRTAMTVAVPGGSGTDQELFNIGNEIYYNLHHQAFQKQIVLFDHDRFFSRPDGFYSHLQYLRDQGMASDDYVHLFRLANTPEAVVRALTDPTVPWTTGKNGQSPFSQKPASLNQLA